MTETAGDDLVPALGLAIAAVAVGSFLPWVHTLSSTSRGTDGLGNLSLLFAGVAGALIARWHLSGRSDRRVLTAVGLLCGATAVVLLAVVAQTAQPQGGLFVASVGAVMATGLSYAARRRASSHC